jgi:hypothetical protein
LCRVDLLSPATVPCKQKQIFGMVVYAVLYMSLMTGQCVFTQPQFPFALLQDLLCCRDVYGVALFVHKCMKTADAAAATTIVPKQQPR